MLLSRNEAIARGWMKHDNASADIISRTDDKWKDWVRFYFGPRTPTLYQNEGIRPVSQLSPYGAHCPVPVYFLFDSREILKRADSMFTDGSLARGAVPRGDAQSFRQLPFEMIYHRSSIIYEDKTAVVYHRHAEVIVPTQVDLGALRHIWCRSQAEYETLLFSLSEGARRRWLKRIGCGLKTNLFYGHWTYVERAELGDRTITFHFNPNSRAPGPFAVRVDIAVPANGGRYFWQESNYVLLEPLSIDISNVDIRDGYQVVLRLDGHLAYANHYASDNLPF